MNKKTKIKQVETESIAYKGNVVVSVMLGNKVIKKYDVGNSSTILMLNNIVYHLLGWPANNVPKFMGLGSSDSTNWNIKHTDLVSPYVGTRVKTEVEAPIVGDTGVTAVFSAIFPYSLIVNKEIKEVGLYATNADRDGLLARIRFTNGIKADGNEKFSLKIDWQITITNVGGSN